MLQHTFSSIGPGTVFFAFSNSTIPCLSKLAVKMIAYLLAFSDLAASKWPCQASSYKDKPPSEAHSYKQRDCLAPTLKPNHKAIKGQCWPSQAKHRDEAELIICLNIAAFRCSAKTTQVPQLTVQFAC